MSVFMRFYAVFIILHVKKEVSFYNSGVVFIAKTFGINVCWGFRVCKRKSFQCLLVPFVMLIVKHKSCDWCEVMYIKPSATFEQCFPISKAKKKKKKNALTI